MVLLSRAHAGPVGPHEHRGSAGLNFARFPWRRRRNEPGPGDAADAGKSEMTEHQSKRILLLATTTGYQTRAFIEAAKRLELEAVFGTDRCHALDDPWQDGALPLRFEDSEGSARQIIEYARGKLVSAIVSIGDRPTLTAARASRALRLLHHPPEAAEACRDKNLSRERLRAAGLDVPAFVRFPLAADPKEIVSSGDVRPAFARGMLFGPVMRGVTSCFQYSHPRSPPAPPPVPLGTTAARGAADGAFGATRRGFESQVPPIEINCCWSRAAERSSPAPSARVLNVGFRLARVPSGG